jgi:hypothetical protein
MYPAIKQKICPVCLTLTFLFLSLSFSSTAQMKGNYTIGKGGDFESFTEAAGALQKQGISGAVFFDVFDGTYNEQFTIGQIPGSSPFNTVVFQSLNRTYANVKLTYMPVDEESNYIVNIAGSEHLGFRHLSFEMTGLGTAFNIGSGASAIAIDSCHLSGVYNTNAYTKYALIRCEDPEVSGIMLRGNVMQNCGYGVFLQAINSNYIENVNIRDNQVNGAGYAAFFLNWVDDPLIVHNHIESAGSAIYAPSVFGITEVTNNTIHAGNEGIEIRHTGSFSEKCLIANNMVCITGSGTGTGIDIRSSNHTNVCFNSVAVYSDRNDSKAFVCSGSTNSIIVNVMNNNFACINDGYAMYVTGTDCISNCDYNNLYTPGNWIARWEENVYDLYDLRHLSGMDLHSLSVNPHFAGTDDLHGRSLHLNGSGTPLMEVTTDIDGQPRDGIHPDIGADEYSVIGLTAMEGDYTVGAAGDYPLLQDAINDLSIRGVSGNVFLRLTDHIIGEQVVITSIPGTGPFSRVTLTKPVFLPKNDSVLIRYASTQQDSNFVIRMHGADHITISGLHIEATGATYARAIEMTGGCDSIEIRYNTIRGAANQNNDAKKCLVYSPGSNYRDRLLVGNQFFGGTIAIYFSGISAYSPFTPGLNVLENHFENIGYSGLWLQFMDAPVVRGNSIDAGYRGIEMSSCSGAFHIDNNKFNLKGQYGIRISGTSAFLFSPGTVSNNFIHVGGAGDAFGISLSSTENVRFAYNSIHITSTDVTDGRAFMCSGIANIWLRNNIFANSGGGYACYISSPTAISSSDYNNMFTTGNKLAYWEGVQANLSDLQAASTMEANSISFDPEFISASDLHTSCEFLTGAATPVSGISEDIDGELRHLIAPDIGADEFSGGGGEEPFTPLDLNLTGVRFGEARWCDYDLDGDLDIITTGNFKGFIYDNTGNNTFSVADRELWEVNNSSISFTDRNQDNLPDLLLTGKVGNEQHTSLFYDGIDSYPEAAENIAALADASAAWFDLDGDGDEDLLLTGSTETGQPYSRIYKNEEGTFYGTPLDRDYQDAGSCLADFTNNGMPDVFVSGVVDGTKEATLYKNVRGVLTASDDINVEAVAKGMVQWIDYDTDGDQDLFIMGITSDMQYITKLYRYDMGSYSEVEADWPGLVNADAAWADYDGDLDPDLVICGFDGTSGITRLYENKQGWFFEVPANLPGVQFGSVDWGDCNNDGHPDLLISGDHMGEAITRVFLNNVDETVADPSPPDRLEATVTLEEVILQWDQDTTGATVSPGLKYNLFVKSGNKYLVSPLSGETVKTVVPGKANMFNMNSYRLKGLEPGATYEWGIQTIDQGCRASTFATGTFTTLDGIFTEGQALTDGMTFGAVEFFDIENDGDLDLILMGRPFPSIAWVLINDNGTYVRSETAYFWPRAEGNVACGDINNDGYTDVVITGVNTYGDQGTDVFLNRQQGTQLDFKQRLQGVSYGFIDLGDVNNDGDLDLVLAGYDKNTGEYPFELYENDGSGNFSPTSFLESITPSASGKAMTPLSHPDGVFGDYDGDGDLDIVLTGYSGSMQQYLSYILENNGYGSFRVSDIDLPGNPSSAVTWCDFNNDGRLDIAIAHASGIDIYKNNDNASYSLLCERLPNNIGYFCGYSDLRCGDYNNDGHSDLLSCGTNGIRVFQYVGGHTGFIEVWNLPVGDIMGSPNNVNAAWGEVNGDGALDLVALHTVLGPGTTNIYLNNSTMKNNPPGALYVTETDFDDLEIKFTFSFPRDIKEHNGVISQINDVSANLRVGSSPGLADVMSPMANSEGKRSITGHGNAGLLGNSLQRNNWKLNLSQLSGLDPDVDLYYAVQAVDAGFLGSGFSNEKMLELSGEITDVIDVPFDQGGKVIIHWDASDLDRDAASLTYYSIWRAVPGIKKQARETVDMHHFSMLNDQPAVRSINTEDPELYWEWVANQPACELPHYAYTCTTLNDSMPESMNEHFFMVTAHTSLAELFFDSRTASGYSVDNLTPYAPVNLKAETQSGAVQLSWTGNAEPDLGSYLVFRGTDPGVDPSSMMPCAEVRDHSYTDTDIEENSVYYYVVCARDIHGNISAPSNEVASMITGLERCRAVIPGEFALDDVYPNPCRNEALIGFHLPVTTDISLEIYDAAGRKVRTLLQATMAPGSYTYTMPIDKSVPPGIYTCLMKGQYAQKVTRMVIIH